MARSLAIDDQMTIEEFLAFTDARPEGERWELIEGVAIMSPSPTDWHKMMVANVTQHLMNIADATNATWVAMPGIGTRVPVSPNSLPQPDVFVKARPLTGLPTTDDALVLFEVLSKSNTKADQAWRRRVYASVANCKHYVAIETRRAEVVRYDRADGWKGVATTGLSAALELPVISASLTLAQIYRRTPIQ